IDRGHLTAPQTMPCGSDADEQILLEPLPCHLRRTHGAIANVYFRDAGADTPDTAAFRGALRRIYGLSANEATLACLLAGGATLADAARQIGLTEESARTYSKRIFAKTGTSRQPALVSLLLRSIATLA
ncbi:MAG TPA: hypothetical protein VFF94_01385, partial [Novosphingobium sp.]|nr:hypothetical protein [Novosphingobium sp.]